jgi:hypothetical protein
MSLIVVQGLPGSVELLQQKTKISNLGEADKRLARETQKLEDLQQEDHPQTRIRILNSEPRIELAQRID